MKDDKFISYNSWTEWDKIYFVVFGSVLWHINYGVVININPVYIYIYIYIYKYYSVKLNQSLE